MKNQKNTKNAKTAKNRNKDDKDQEELPMDLTFCFQANIILNEALKKAEYIGAYTTSNSKNAMSKVIGQQIYNKLKKQEELEKDFARKRFSEIDRRKSQKSELNSGRRNQ